MPTRERVQALIGLVEGGRYVEAIEAFFYEDASMQENLDPPRHGRDTLVRGERRVIEAHRSIRTRPVNTFMVEGDRDRSKFSRLEAWRCEGLPLRLCGF